MIVNEDPREVFDDFIRTAVELNLFDGDDIYENFRDVSDFIFDFSVVKSIFILGLNPSDKSPDNSAFHLDTKSRKTVDKWFGGETKYYIYFDNLVHMKTKDSAVINEIIKANFNRKKYAFKLFHNKIPIIALGRKVSDTLYDMDIVHYAMPHPSGLNRFWNDHEASKNEIQSMLRWIELFYNKKGL